MLTIKNFRPDQHRAVAYMRQPHVMVWIEPGGGKTVVALTVIVNRINAGEIKKALVFAPLRVVHAVWRREALKWEHTKHLRFSIIGGVNEKKRLKGLAADADVYLCNYESMGWLSNQLVSKPSMFQFVVYDEITKVKESTSQRIVGGKRKKTVKGVTTYIKITGWRKMIPGIPYTVGLTGSPASNGYLDLFGQYLVIDGGQRLGQYITHYREAYFTKGWDGFSWNITDIGKHFIDAKITDITLHIENKNIKYPTINNIMIDLPPKVMTQYKQIEKNMFTRLGDGTEIEVFNKTSVSNKCLQFGNGAYYINPGKPEWNELHDVKLEALDEIVEESQGKTILLGYIFKSDAERIMKRYKKLNPINLTGVPANQFLNILDKGNRGEIKLMVGHPASLGHGIDGLHDFCQIIVWFGLPWSLELYEQFNGRIASGERFKKPVTIHRILADNTIDLVVADALLRKDDTQNGLKKAIDRYRDGGGVLNFW